MHCIRGFIGENQLISNLADSWVNAGIVPLEQGFSMIFLTDDLHDDILELVDSKYKIEYDSYFDYFSASIYELLETESRNGKLAYIETDYFGGVGSQSAILFEKGVLKGQPCRTQTIWDEKNNKFMHIPDGERAINIVLKELGVFKETDKDEFDSVRLGNYRRMG